MTDQGTLIREHFARLVTPILVASSRAIDQALDRGEPPITPECVKHYTNTIREMCSSLEEALLEGEGIP